MIRVKAGARGRVRGRVRDGVRHQVCELSLDRHLANIRSNWPCLNL